MKLPLPPCLGSKARSYLSRSGFLLLLMTLITAAVQAQTVTGKITDENGTGMPGVNVILKNTTTGTTSDANGNFSLNVPSANNPVLVFSFIGYETQEIAVNNQTTINVSLAPNVQSLDEVVVIGYGTAKKSDVTGALVQMDEKSLREVPVSNITQGLQGRMAGVEILNTSSRPGSNPLIRIRGSRSLPNEVTNGNGGDANYSTPSNNDPLIVVDGIPFNGSINDLNPNDIVSLDVLKDASATAIYGSRGSNGVIIVTTRRGKQGRPMLTYDGYHGVNSVIGKYRLYNGTEFQAFRTSAGTYPNPTPDETASLTEGKETDWQDLLYKKGYITNHALGLTGGTENTQYSLSAGYFKQTTVLPGQDFTRYSLGGALDQTIGERIKIGFNTLNTLNVKNGENYNPMFQILTMSPLYKAYNDDGTIKKFPAVGSADPNTINPLYLYDKDLWKQERRIMRTFNSLYGELKIIEGLKYRINIGLDYFHDEYGQFQSSDSPFLNTNQNSAQVRTGNGASYTIENLAIYDKTIAENHKLNITALYSAQQVENTSTTTTVNDVLADYLQFYNIGLANTYNSATGNYAKSGLISYMGRINYGYSNRYLLTLTMRRDGSSRLAKGNQFFNYPAAAVAWNIHNESFMSGIKAISNLKLRAGLGQTSNQAINPYQSLGALVRVPYNFGTTGLYGLPLNVLPNPNLTWEFTTSTNIGLDFGLFTNRISGSVELYQQKTSDILQSRNLPPTSGVSSITQNIGKTQNKGIEVTLSTVNIESKQAGGLTWSTDWNFFVNRNEITELAGGTKQDINNGWFVGQPIDAIFDYEKIGIWQLGEEAEAKAFSGNLVPGDIRVKDQITVDTDGDGKPDAGDGLFTAADRKVLGSLQPTWSGGLTNRFTYKGFDLSVVLFAKVGGMLISTLYQANQGTPYNTLEGRRSGPKVDYWTPENPTNAYPRAGLQQPVNGSTLGYFDATFMKIRSISLGYDLPAAVFGNTGINSLHVYLQAQNPFKAFFSPYVKEGGLDPETTAFGGSNTTGWGNRVTVQPNTPPTKQFILGVNIKY